jgi:fluoride exporter
MESGHFYVRAEFCRRKKGRYNLLKFIMVGIGGFVGAVARFWLGSYIIGKLGTRFPYGTFVINISGSFLVGLILTLLDQKGQWDSNWRYLIPIGFIGAYTTFSAFEYETLRSVQQGEFLMSFLNVTLSVLVGFAAVWAGFAAGKAIA